MQRLLIGFDGSEEARDALRLGSMLSGATGSDLVVAAALAPVPAGVAIDVASLERRYFDDVFSKARAQLGNTSFERRELGHVSAPRGLDQMAQAEDADLIVVGSTHRGNVGRVLFGSVGERLLYGAPCPVAVAPRGYAGRDHAGTGVIGVAYDGSEESKLALAQAKELATALDGKLRLITVIFEWLYVPETSPSRSLEDFMEVVRGEHRAVQKRALEEFGDSVEVEAALDEGDPATILAGHGVDLDLLVIGSRGYGPVRRTLLGGVSSQVMRTAQCPVVVVPRGAGPG